MQLSYDPKVHQTAAGTSYLKEPGVALVAMPQFLPMQATQFVNSFGDTFDAADYENDWFEQGEGHQHLPDYAKTMTIDDAAALCKFAGQTCYLSFGEKRTRNAEAKRYFDNIKESGHGSVLQHANFSLVIWGIDRACSHEIVRHAVGTAYSQMSQRYVSGKTLRFVERTEYQDDDRLHFEFEQWIDKAREQYDLRAELMAIKMQDRLKDVPATERRKTVNQAARNCLPNETETAMVMTGNVRAWRHVIEMRASRHADLPINKVAFRVFEILRQVSPILFDDYTMYELPRGERVELVTSFKKV